MTMRTNAAHRQRRAVRERVLGDGGDDVDERDVAAERAAVRHGARAVRAVPAVDLDAAHAWRGEMAHLFTGCPL